MKTNHCTLVACVSHFKSKILFIKTLLSIQEADIGLGLFAINPKRTEVIEFTVPMLIGSLKVFAGRKSLQVNPWGFILPLAPLVWAAIMTSLLVVSTAMFLYYILFHKRVDVEKVISKTLHNTGILFQQSTILLPVFVCKFSLLSWCSKPLIIILFVVVTLIVLLVFGPFPLLPKFHNLVIHYHSCYEFLLFKKDLITWQYSL